MAQAHRSTRSDHSGAYNMETINRAVAIIKPRQPYHDWATGIPGPADDVTLDEMRTDCTAILIPDFDTPAESEAFIAGIATDLFELELAAWHLDTTEWPEDRDYARFREWFDVEIHTVVFDVADGGIFKEPF